MEELKRKIEWKLLLPKGEQLRFPVRILLDEKSELQETDLDSSGDLLGILQDAFYITHWSKILQVQDEDPPQFPKDELDVRDDYWDIFRWIWNEFVKIVHENYIYILDNHNSDKSKILSEMKGSHYTHFVEKDLGEPYLSRYKLYRILSLLRPKNKLRALVGSCTDIICYFKKFANFWNQSLSILSCMVIDIQEKFIEQLRLEFEQILHDSKDKGKYVDFRKAYLVEDRKCFSNTIVKKKDGNVINLLCFSGVWFKDSIKSAIDKIAQSAVFQPNKIIDVRDEIRYYWTTNEYITLKQAKKCCLYSNKKRKKDGYNLMFSCCERKTVADFNWTETLSYTMLIKYPPCQMCDDVLNRHAQKYNGDIKVGKENSKLFPDAKKKEGFDRLAICISLNKP